MRPRIDLAVFVASLAQGGVGKMRVHLMNEIVNRGYGVDLVLADDHSPYLDLLDPKVHIQRVATSNAITGVPAVAAYLLRRRPRVMLAQRIRVNVLAQRANRLVGSPSRMFVTANTNISAQLASLQPSKRERQLALLRRYYPRNAGVIAVSKGVADDLSQLIDFPRSRIATAPNPVVSPDLYRLAEQSTPHPWFRLGEPPVVIGVGRLEPQKDFATFLRAFKIVRAERPCRCVILGEGKQRAALEALARELGIGDDVEMPGFAPNPYAYLSRAGLFVLSSAWEGSPNVLVEALALGLPVAATDCRDGPREILEDGRYGPLVPVGDVSALATAMQGVLDQPLDAEELRDAARPYTPERSATAYLTAMGLGRSTPADG